LDVKREAQSTVVNYDVLFRKTKLKKVICNEGRADWETRDWYRNGGNRMKDRKITPVTGKDSGWKKVKRQRREKPFVWDTLLK